MSLSSSSGMDVTDRCPHLNRAAKRFPTGEDLATLLSNPRCDDCGGQESNLWLCLFPDCYMLGCSSGQDHSTRHQAKFKDHVLQFNIQTKRIWCYGCNSEVRTESAFTESCIPKMRVSRKIPSLLFLDFLPIVFRVRWDLSGLPVCAYIGLREKSTLSPLYLTLVALWHGFGLKKFVCSVSSILYLISLVICPFLKQK